MLSKSFSNVYRHAYTYLGYKNIDASNQIDNLIDECLCEIEDISQFKYIYLEFDEKLDFIKNNKAYLDLLDKSSSYYLILTTLGRRIDDKIKYYSKTNLVKSLVFDACASAYLEYMANDFEAHNLKNPHTFRFCPGYSNTSTDDIRQIAKYINFEKNGVEINESNLMIPLKSMAGIIGVGNSNKKSCDNCILNDKCRFKKEGLTCYQN